MFKLHSQDGQRLLARCRSLLAENQELGQQLSEGKIAKLEGELAIQKKLLSEKTKSQDGE